MKRDSKWMVLIIGIFELFILVTIKILFTGASGLNKYKTTEENFEQIPYDPNT